MVICSSYHRRYNLCISFCSLQSPTVYADLNFANFYSPLRQENANCQTK